MEYKGFGRNSGPNGPPRAQSQSPFGHFPRPPSPSPPPFSSSPRDLDAPESFYTSPLAFESNRPVRGPSHVFTRVQRPGDFTKGNIGKQTAPKDYDGQTHDVPSMLTPLGASNNLATSRPAKAVNVQDLGRMRSPPFPSTFTPPSASNNFGNGGPAKAVEILEPKRSRSPSFSSQEYLRKSAATGGSRPEYYNHQRPVYPQQTSSPPLAFRKSPSGGTGPFDDAQSSGYSPFVWVNQSKVFSDLADSDVASSGRKSPAQNADLHVPKRPRSPPLPSSVEAAREDTLFVRNDSKRPSVSPPRLRSSDISGTSLSRSHGAVPSVRLDKADVVANEPVNAPIAKRTKLPSLPLSDQVFEENPTEDIERELQAKAKRLARFRDELSQPLDNGSSIQNQKVPAKRQHLPTFEKRKISGELMTDMSRDLSNDSVLPDYEATDSLSIIVGSCLDMCPESERAERERKGDLDQYERLDGDRNQTSILLAVKKYNRTAEREAELIRPMPVLQKTMDYLLNLLNQPYDDRFLSLYNFLWDRMRAIRMDLRMQHIFGVEAISMLEQMIRLHIIAMHELCEYTKGEGFSEGFDAHLNIEQMNKTSVELFQLYDDHRKKGQEIQTEKEFRGYYALLKLDKHPGYKVEPAELSLDLAKMTPEIRQTAEVLFARDVARACRTGNFIAFFRLARKASYLQACLMHAHFGKLRTQALGSLHSGLLNNQGIPVSQVAEWLGMENEDIEALVEYYGFSIKEFEEPYMVKDGPFLNVDDDYPIRCSELVHRKKAGSIVEDVSSPSLPESYAPEEKKMPLLDKDNKQVCGRAKDAGPEASINGIDKEILNDIIVSSPTDLKPVKPIVLTTQMKPIVVTTQVKPIVVTTHQWIPDLDMISTSPPSSGFSIVHSSPESQQSKFINIEKPIHDTFFRNSFNGAIFSDSTTTPMLQFTQEKVDIERLPVPSTSFAVENLSPEHVHVQDLDDYQRSPSIEGEADEAASNYYDEEVFEAKLKLILRIWNRLTSKKKALRELKQSAANAALNSLSLGAPIWHHNVQPTAFGELNINHVMNERYEREVRSWSRLNVSELIAATLSRRNPDVKCLCWKILLSSRDDSSSGNRLGQSHKPPDLSASSWLLSKLMPAGDVDDVGLALSMPGLSIWRWIPDQSGVKCCLSVIKDAKSENANEAVAGAGAILFLISESIPWQLHRNRLDNLLVSLPAGSRLPLLILSDSCVQRIEKSTIIKELGLQEIDQSRIHTFSIASLKTQEIEDFDGFFSDGQLREGLEWLANESPLQPNLHHLNTREVVLSYLDFSFHLLRKTNAASVSPNHCISAFNEALDQLMAKVVAAAHANPTCWPCPEIFLLDETSHEYNALYSYFPSPGWSSTAKIEPLICALSDTKLPAFEDDVSWLYSGSDRGKDVDNQKLLLQDHLVKYFVESCQMMGLQLARKEASIMLQKFARLELHNSTFYIVPDWVMIFRRVCNWRLMSLSRGPFSSAFILVQHDSWPISESVDIMELEDAMSKPYFVIHPSLDEMVEVGCSALSPTKLNVEHKAFENAVAMTPERRRISTQSIQNHVEGNVEYSSWLDKIDDHTENVSTGDGSRTKIAFKASKEADKLTNLLQQCNIVQNMIDQKLSIYF